MQVFRIEPLINIQRFQRINELATSPERVHAAAEDLVVAKNLQFIRQCIKAFKLIEFLDPGTKQLYMQVSNGKFSVIDQGILNSMLSDKLLQETLSCLAPELLGVSG